MWLLNTVAGMYVVQTFMHSFIYIIIIERAIQIWNIKNPLTEFRYRIMTIIMPVVMLPVYQLFNQERGSLSFREKDALFDSNRWLSIEIYHFLSFRTVFILLLMLTSLIFFFQEILPVLRHIFNRDVDRQKKLPPNPVVENMVRELCSTLGIQVPPVRIIDDIMPFIYVSGSNEFSINLSSGLIKTFDTEQVRSAIAHELAHIIRRSNITTWLIFIIRTLMFFNPIALIVFRRVVQDDEHVCDDITVSLTGDPYVLASTLKVFYAWHVDIKSLTFGSINAIKEGIEDYSHNLLLRERIARLESGTFYNDRKFEWWKFLLTISTIIILNYYVV